MGIIDQVDAKRKKGMVLPFRPLCMTFEDLRYAVDMPQVYSSNSQNLKVC